MGNTVIFKIACHNLYIGVYWDGGLSHIAGNSANEGNRIHFGTETISEGQNWIVFAEYREMERQPLKHWKEHHS